MASERKMRRKLTSKDFKTLMAPVFTSFKNDDECSLELQYVDRYARWLKNQGVRGVLVNSITGEGPALGFDERKLNAEAWSEAAQKHDLIFMVQIGGAPLPDVLSLAQHAESIGAQAVVCFPEIYNKPQNIAELISYCKIVANRCNNLPFLYNHAPDFTAVKFDMSNFCDEAQRNIPNFIGLLFCSHDIELGANCLQEGRVVMLGMGTMLGSAMMLGFEAAMLPWVNGRPKLFWSIYNSVKSKNLQLAKQRQKEAMDMINNILKTAPIVQWAPLAKAWFNRMMSGIGGAGFSAGPSRKFF